MSSETSSSRTATVAKNFAWGSLERLLEIAAAFYTTVAVARAFGPAKLGYFNYIFWLTTISGTVGTLGLSGATFKYMGEYIGANRLEVAHSIYRYMLRVQSVLAITITAVGIALVRFLVLPEYRLISIILVIAVFPQAVMEIPSLANVARQNFRANVQASFIGGALNVLGIVLTLHLNWGLLGVSCSVLAGRTVELLLKARSISSWLRSVPWVPLPRDLYKRIVSFSTRGLALMLLNVVIWDRSDMVLLKLLQPDIRQLAFFSVSFSLVQRLMILPQGFGNALAASQMSEAGRDKKNLLRVTATALIYTLLGSLPLLFGSSCLSGPAIHLIYGLQYLPAVPVFALAAAFAIPKAILPAGYSLLYAEEDLGFLLKWSCVCAAAEILIDVALIPRYTAIGATIGNGVAQSLAAAGIWTRAVRYFQVELDFRRIRRVSLATAVMVIAVLIGMQTLHSDVTKMIAVPVLGAAVFILMLRLVSVLDYGDRSRFLAMTSRLPRPLCQPVRAVVAFVSNSPMKAES